MSNKKPKYAQLQYKKTKPAKEPFSWKKIFADKRVIWLFIGIAICFAISFFSSEEDNSIALPAQFDAAAVEEAARQVVSSFNDADYQSIFEMSQGLMEQAYTAEEFAEKCDVYAKELGAFSEISEVALNGYVDEKTGEQYARARVKAKYEHGTATFGMAFSEDMKLVTFGVQ